MSDNGIRLHYVDTVPAQRAGVTWGLSFARGELAAGGGMHVQRADGTRLATQCWPLAYWPDGSVKWLGMAAALGPEDGRELFVRPGAGPAPAAPVTVSKAGIEVMRYVDTGVFRAEVGDRGRYVIQEIVRDGRSSVGGVELVCLLERRGRDGRDDVRRREPFAGIIEQLTVEQSGPVRAVVKLTGRYRGEQSGRLWLPFTLRVVAYAGCDSVELVHSFVFDGDAEADFIAGLGVRAHVLLHEGVHNRLVRIVGEDGKGVWAEPVRMLPYAGHAATPEQLTQLRGEAVAAPLDGGLLPAWNDFQLVQDSCDHAVLRKRQGEQFCWVTAEHCRRAPGIVSLSEPAGGAAVGVRDFWQAYPTAVETVAAGGTEAHIQAWWWSPEAEPMDLRHYGGRDHRPVYEARNPDPAVYSSPYGIARTSSMTLWTLPAGSTGEALRARQEQIVRPAVLAAAPEHYRRGEVFGPHWSPVDRSTPARAAVEDELAKYLDYHLLQREQWRWYGFWHYGDFMHTYDPQRHCWHYDRGGSAWDNTELGADIWPWLMYLRSGRGEWFRFAEAMTRHVGEVDVFHAGAWTGQGSRHNVVHWGCPCKEPRASQAGPKRFMHYLTADERCRDLLDELAEKADRFKATNVPTEKTMARIGPTWAAWSANWMCAWERTGDAKWLEKIRTGLRGILSAPHKLMQGDPFDYSPDTGEMCQSDEWPFPHARLALTMGGAEAWMEMAGLIEHEAFSDALADWGVYHATEAKDADKLPPGVWMRMSILWANAKLSMWAAVRRSDEKLKRRAWEMLLHGDGDPRERHTWRWPLEVADAPPGLSAEKRRDGDLHTNNAAQGSLNLMACLAMAPEVLDAVWRK
jgi:hypothetical protein